MLLIGLFVCLVNSVGYLCVCRSILILLFGWLLRDCYLTDLADLLAFYV